MQSKRIYADEAALADMLSGLDGALRDVKIFCTESTGSTNADAKNAARDATSDAIFISKKQTAGRGRLGRTFVSEEGGLYMSMLFKREMRPTDAVKITSSAAVCVARAIEALTDIRPQIKWVNDIYVGGMKLAGILCEGACDRFGSITHAVLGIGVNLYPPRDASVSEIATSVSEHTANVPSVLALAAEIVKQLSGASRMSFSDILSEYRRRSCVIGRRVRVIRYESEYLADAVGIDECGALIVVRDDGTEEHIATGDVSIRL